MVYNQSTGNQQYDRTFARINGTVSSPLMGAANDLATAAQGLTGRDASDSIAPAALAAYRIVEALDDARKVLRRLGQGRRLHTQPALRPGLRTRLVLPDTGSATSGLAATAADGTNVRLHGIEGSNHGTMTLIGLDGTIQRVLFSMTPEGDAVLVHGSIQASDGPVQELSQSDAQAAASNCGRALGITVSIANPVLMSHQGPNPEGVTSIRSTLNIGSIFWQAGSALPPGASVFADPALERRLIRQALLDQTDSTILPQRTVRCRFCDTAMKTGREGRRNVPSALPVLACTTPTDSRIKVRLQIKTEIYCCIPSSRVSASQ